MGRGSYFSAENAISVFYDLYREEKNRWRQIHLLAGIIQPNITLILHFTEKCDGHYQIVFIAMTLIDEA